jgi:hypothetical protein
VIPGLIMGDDHVHVPNLADVVDDGVELWRDTGDAVVAYSAMVNGRHWIDMPSVARFCFEGAGSDVKAHPYPGARAEVVRDAYRRAVLPMVVQARGMEVLHASAVVTDTGVVAFCGQSGTGKSTIAVGLGCRGYRIWADDTVAFESPGAAVLAIPLPFGIQLRPEAAAFFARSGNDAPMGRLHFETERGSSPAAPLVAVCMLERVSSLKGGVAAARLPSVSALRAVLPHAFCFSLRDPRTKRRMMEHYLRLVERIPCFAIRFRPGLERLSVILDAIEQEAIGSQFPSRAAVGASQSGNDYVCDTPS